MVGDPPAAAISVLLFRGMIEIPDARSRAESVRLAERYFALFQQGDVAGMLALLHPDVEWVLKSTRPGDVLRGKGDTKAFFDRIAGKFYELIAEVYRPLDDERVVVEGRLRWMDDDRVLRDDPVVWAFQFRDGLVSRVTPVQSVAEAEAILAGSR